MQYLIISFTHKNTDIALRERLALNSDAKKKEILRLICAAQNISECMAISTCNRVELIAVCDDTTSATKHILNALKVITGVDFETLEYYASVYEGSGAIHHFFSVASSLDSLVVGENQIAGQLKEAFKFAYESANAGGELSFLIHWAFKTAAKVKSLTQISKNPVSISSVAVAKAKEIYENMGASLGGMSAVVVGAGQMASLLAKHLVAAHTNVIIVNRSRQRADALASELGSLASVEDWDELAELINRYALIFVATAAPKAIITDELIEERDFRRYIFDICVPRNVDVKESFNIDIYAVDDLDEIVKGNIALRQEEATAAFGIVNDGVAEFFKAIKQKHSAPSIKALRQRAKDICESELEKAIKHGYLKRSDENEARKLLHQVFKAFLHKPTVRLKDRNDSDTISALEFLFDLEITSKDKTQF